MPEPSPGAPVTLSRAGRRVALAAGILTGLAVALWLVLDAMRGAVPDPESPLVLDVTWPRAVEGSKLPLVSTGEAKRADFLVFEILTEGRARLAYDHWGSGGPASEPFPYQPGVRQRLEILLPSLPASPPRMKAPLRVAVDDKVRFEAVVRSHGRQPGQIFLGINPIGGTSCQTRFDGTIEHANRGIVKGGPESFFSRAELLRALWARHPGRLAWALICGLAIGALAHAAVRRVWTWDPSPLLHRTWRRRTAAPHGTFVIVLALCALVFGWVITQGTLRLIYPESFGAFYDQQAKSLLQGRLDVPEGAIMGEAFVVKGKYYGYFGVTPALLRLPLAAFDGLKGEVSRAYMLAYYVLGLAAAYSLLCHGTRRVAGPGTWPSRLAVVLLVGGSGLGSTLLFLGSRAYTYHEAILAGGAFALATTVAVLRWVETGRRTWAALALALGLAALHARPTPGLFALGLLGAAALWRAWQGRTRRGWREPLLWAAGAGLGILTFNGMSYLKFGTWDGSPFRYAVQYTPDRRARFEDRNFHLANLGHNTDTYVFSADVDFSRRFPFLRFGGRGPGGTYEHMRIDLEEFCVAMPVAMPALFLLATVAAFWAAAAVPALRVPLGLLTVAVLPMALALFTAIVTSHRYTGDFCAWLIAAGALALAALDAEASRHRKAALAVIGVLTTWAVALNLALALQYQGEMVWGVPDEAKQRYERMRERTDRLLGTAKP